MLPLLELDLGGSADLYHGHSTDQLRLSFLELLLVEVGGRLLDLGLDLLDSCRDRVLGSLALDDGRLVLVSRYPAGAAEVFHGDRLQLAAHLFGDDDAAGQNGNVLKHRLAPVAEAGGFDRKHIEGAAQFVDHQRGQRLTIDVLGKDQKVLGHLEYLLQGREEIGHRGNLLVGNQDVGVFDLRFHLLGIGDEVRADIAAVELHSLDKLGLVLQTLGLLNGDDAVLADLLHHLGNQIADLGVHGGYRGHLGNLVLALDLGRLALELLDDCLGSHLDALLQRHRLGPGGDVLEAVGDDGVGQ